MNIFVSVTVNQSEREQLLSLGSEDHFFFHNEFSDVDPIHPDFLNSSICFGNVPVKWLEKHHKLEWIQLISVGFGEYLEMNRDRLDSKFCMTNLKGFFAEPVAQSMLAGLLSLYRGMDLFAVLKEKVEWIGDPLREKLKSLHNANVLLYGYGSINRQFEKILQPFDCKITTINRSDTIKNLENRLIEADVVSSVVPDHPKTRKIFNEKCLKLFKPEAVFLNFGRGSVVDEKALSESLMKGNIGGAVIDVTIEEPLPKYHPFWKCPNTIITQHSAGGTMGEISKKISWFSENLLRFRNGEKLLSPVNFELGY